MSKDIIKKGVIYPDYMTELRHPGRTRFFLEQQDWYVSAREAGWRGYVHWLSNRIPYVSVHETPLLNKFHQGPLSRF